MASPYKLVMIESRTAEDQQADRTEQGVLGSVFLQLGIKVKRASCKTRHPGLIFSHRVAKWGGAGGHFWHDASYYTNIITPAQ